MNPQMWAGSGVKDPRKIGKPPGQGGFTVQDLLPPNVRTNGLPPFTGGA